MLLASIQIWALWFLGVLPIMPLCVLFTRYSTSTRRLPGVLSITPLLDINHARPSLRCLDVTWFVSEHNFFRQYFKWTSVLTTDTWMPRWQSTWTSWCRNKILAASSALPPSPPGWSPPHSPAPLLSPLEPIKYRTTTYFTALQISGMI